MTTSAPVKLSPVPPAFREIKKTSPSPSLKRVANSMRLSDFVSPVNVKYEIPNASSFGAIKSNIDVNCENNKIRCPLSLHS